MNIIRKSKEIVLEAHKNQKRKGSKKPFISHLYTVTEIIETFTKDENLISVGWLHDLIEDTNYTIEDLKDFPEEILKFISYETEDKSKSWINRKREQINHLKNIPESDKEVLVVAFADKLANLRELHEGFLKKDIKVFDIFNEKDPEKQFLYYNSFYNIFLKNKKLFQNNLKLLKEYENILISIWGRTETNTFL